MPWAGLQRLAGVAGLAALAGCASLAPPVVPVLSGRLSVQVAAHAGQPARGMNAAFELEGDGQAGALRLSSTFGPQLADARWSPGQATLRTSEGERTYADLDSLAHDALGEALPLQALPDWLRGRPWPGAPSQARPEGFEQLGWELDLVRWGEGFVSATRRAVPAVTLRARLTLP